MWKTVSEREIAALLNPRLAILVTCCDRSGKPNVLTVAWHTPLSHSPPMLGISIAPSRFSYGLICDQGEFALNIVGASMLEAVRICGKYSGAADDKFSIAQLNTQKAEKIQPPVLSDALGILECRVRKQVKVGDHTLFVGEVLLARAREDCFVGAWECGEDEAVLQCLQRDRYGTFVELGHELE